MSSIKVTRHAVKRYWTRVMHQRLPVNDKGGIISIIKVKLPEIAKYHNGVYPVGDGIHCAIVKQGIVITIVKSKWNTK